MLPYIVYSQHFRLEGYLTSCCMDIISRDTFTRYSYVNMLIFGFFLPCFVIVVFYTLIVLELSPYMQKKKFSSDFRRIQRCKKTRQDIAAFKSAIIIFVLFIISWAPYAILCTYAQFGVEIAQTIGPHSITLASSFAKASSIFNPALYTLSNQKCKNYFLKKKKRNATMLKDCKCIRSQTNVEKNQTECKDERLGEVAGLMIDTSVVLPIRQLNSSWSLKGDNCQVS